jgi:hypothetical protein
MPRAAARSTAAPAALPFAGLSIVRHQEVAAVGHADGYDGVVNDYFLVSTTRFDPRGALSDDELAAEDISGMVAARGHRRVRRNRPVLAP